MTPKLRCRYVAPADKSAPKFWKTGVLGLVLAFLVGFAAQTAVPAEAAVPARVVVPHNVRLCPVSVAPRHATCFAVARVGQPGHASPLGLTPNDLWSAYRLPATTRGAGQTIAIIDAYGYATAETDLSAYRAQYGLRSCTSANRCFRKVSQGGGVTYPPFDLGWAQETALDLDMASAICPRCALLLVEAYSTAFVDLGAAVDTAVRLGATVISNSYGGPDTADPSLTAYYRHPGVAITASTGDDGYQGASFPASTRTVTAVGGTSLVPDPTKGRGWNETAWSGAGSGCSTVNPALSGTSLAGTGCSGRAIADVAAVANPDTGVAVFAPIGKYTSQWQTYGGTSAAAPIIAGVFALAGNAHSVTPSTPYAHRTALFDIVDGGNGICPIAQWCAARAGWDGPSGLGSPNGIGAF